MVVFIPFVVILAVIEIGFGELRPFLDKIPGLAVVEKYDPGNLLGDPQIQNLLVGAWFFYYYSLYYPFSTLY